MDEEHTCHKCHKPVEKKEEHICPVCKKTYCKAHIFPEDHKELCKMDKKAKKIHMILLAVFAIAVIAGTIYFYNHEKKVKNDEFDEYVYQSYPVNISFDKYFANDYLVNTNVSVTGYLWLAQRQESLFYDNLIIDDYNQSIILEGVVSKYSEFFNKNKKSEEVYKVKGVYRKDGDKRFINVKNITLTQKETIIVKTKVLD
jgi:hypothetical protein